MNEEQFAAFDAWLDAKIQEALDVEARRECQYCQEMDTKVTFRESLGLPDYAPRTDR